MVDLRTQFRSLLWNHGGKLAEYALMYFFSVYVARTLGVEKNSAYIILITIVQTGLLISSIGFETTLHRFVPAREGAGGELRALLRPLLSFRLGAQAVLAAILLLGLPILSAHFSIGGMDERSVVLLCVYAFLAGMNNFFGAVLVGQSRTHVLSALRVSVRLCELAAVVTIGLYGLTIEAVVAVIAAGALVNAVLHVVVAFRDLAGGEEKSDLGPVMSFAGAMWLNMFVVFILGKQMDILLLGKLASDVKEIAYYDVGMMLVQVIVLGTTIGMGGVMLSTFAGVVRDRPAMLPRLWRLWVKLSMVLMIPLLVVIAFGADPVVGAVYGPSYMRSAPLVRILAIFVVFERLFGSGLNADALLATGRERAVLRISIGCGLFNVVAAVALIPAFGAAGAITATGVGNLGASISMALVLRRNNRMAVPALFWSKTVLISVAACAVPAVLNHFTGNIHPVVQLILAAALWGFFAKTVGLFTEDDIEMIGGMNPSLAGPASFFAVERSMRRMSSLS